MPLITYFFQLLVAHAIADFVLQHEAMVAGKNRCNKIHDGEGINYPPWYYWLSAHALVHGGAVYLVTGSLVLGIVETVLHWFIDFSKIEKWLNFHQDQALHLCCKVGYCFLI